jgi:hypothetical protein
MDTLSRSEHAVDVDRRIEAAARIPLAGQPADRRARQRR